MTETFNTIGDMLQIFPDYKKNYKKNIKIINLIRKIKIGNIKKK